ncbi:MAG TPA: hypothetical protein VGY48_19130 [Vicinamibacterales bacterium]|jgi:hypothetical protein|nr:hypothetical protein [Vicinamibacterales bacterium]
MKKIACACSVLVLGIGVLWFVMAKRIEAGQGSASSKWPTFLKDGQPDVQGGWQAAAAGGGGAGTNLEDLANMMGSGHSSPGIVIDPPDGKIPYLPWARVRRDEVRDHHLSPNRKQVDTRNRGWPDGVPRINYYFVNPFQIVQPAGAVLILYETQHEFRYIPLDGRPQIDDGVKLWMGSSRGHWEGTTLVVDVSNVYDRVRLSIVGDFASDQVKMTERWKFVDADTIAHSATITDPNVFTRPFTVAKTIKRIKDKDFEILEYAGVEGEKDQELMSDIPKKAGSTFRHDQPQKK